MPPLPPDRQSSDGDIFRVHTADIDATQISHDFERRQTVSTAARPGFATSEKGKFVANAEALKTSAKFADETPSMFAAETLEVQEDYATPDDRTLPGCRPYAATLAHAPVTAPTFAAVPVDAVCALGVLNQMSFWSSVSQSGRDPQDILCVVDTGAGSGYLLLPSHSETVLPFQFRRCHAPVSLADGSAVNITQCVDLVMTVAHRKESVCLKVLRTQADCCTILFGRDLISQFNLVIHGCDRIMMDRTNLYDRRRDVICFVDSPEQEAAPKGAGGLHEIDAAPSFKLADLANEMMTLPIDPGVVDSQIALLKSKSKEPPRPMAFCLGVKMGLRELQPNEARDTPGQRFVFEIDAPKIDPSTTPARLYAASCYARLPPDRQSEFKALVQGYVDAGWWTTCSRAEAAMKYGHPANIFGVVQKEKLRLVADFRQLNLHFAASTKMPYIHHTILGLSLCAKNGLVVGDCKTAFLKVRLKRPLWVHTGVADYLTHRMSFGLSFGPEGLRSSAGLLWEMFKDSCIEDALGSLFVDDWFLSMAVELLKQSAAIFLSFLDLCGFDCSRKKFQILEESGTAKLFNCGIIVKPESIAVDCQRADRMKQLGIMLRENKWTKARVFAIAGLLSYDISCQHTAARLVADLLRSIIGSACSTRGWHSPIDTASLCPVDNLLFNALLKWAEELVHEPCRHLVPRNDTDSVFLLLHVDASFSGYGFCLSFRHSPSAEWTTVQRECAVWKRREMSYSINRLEAMALFYALRSVALFLEHLGEALFKPGSRSLYLTVETDNAPTVTWATKGTTGVSERSTEYRPIARLSVALDEELQILHKICKQVIIRHVAGVSNQADSLSRLLERPVGDPAGGQTIGTLYRERTLKKPATSDDVGLVEDAAVESPHLVEELAKISNDIEDVLQRFASFRRLLRGWRDVARQERAGQSDPAITRAMSWNQNYDSNDEAAFADVMNTSADDKPSRLKYNSWNGVERELWRVPKRFPWVQDRIARFYHRLNAHRGARHTLSDIVAAGRWFLEGGLTAVKRLTAGCLICALKNGSLAVGPPVMPTATFARSITLPVFSRVSVDHLYTKPKCSLSVVCLDTGYLSLVPVDDRTTRTTVAALQKIAHRYSVCFKLVHSDSFSSFTSPQLIRELRSLGHYDCQVSFTPPAASDLNPVERYHREVWSTLRCRKFCVRLSEAMTSGIESALEGACFIINSRPLAFDPPETLITPATLAFGVATHASEPPDKKFLDVRRLFYEQFFDQLRRRFASSNQRKSLIRVGALVLAKLSDDKEEFRVRPARIISIDGAVISVKAGGKFFRLSSTQLVPLGQNFQSGDPIIPTPTSPPGEGT